jgi:ATP-binding cassette subfamily C (CFTR/MRP) protein 1
LNIDNNADNNGIERQISVDSTVSNGSEGNRSRSSSNRIRSSSNISDNSPINARGRTLSIQDNKERNSNPNKAINIDGKNTKLTTVEEQAMGDVEFSSYSFYVKAGGLCLFFSILFSSLAAQIIGLLASFYLSNWGEITLRERNKGTPLTSQDNIDHLNIFATISMFSVVMMLTRSILLANHRLGTSTLLHSKLLKQTLGAPVAFFDVTPLGRILNRFSSDMLTIDEELSQTINQVLNSLSACLGSMGAILGATKGTFIILMIPLIFVYNAVQGYFRKTNTTVARLEAVSRSPIYGEFSAALTGVNSIRAYKEQDRFINHMQFRLDSNSVAAITQQLAGQWLAIRLDVIGGFISFFIAIVAVTTDGFIPPGYLAIGLTYSFQLTSYLKFCVRMMASGEAQMNAVERIKFYIDKIDQELTIDPLPLEDIPEDWPAGGSIVSKGVEMRYREGPLVLKGLNFDVQGSSKIGIAGRTGSGKSSLMVAIFRINELAKGSIIIDGLDTARIPLNILRSRIGIIPQDPVMFSATVRFNLDPFDKHTERDLWDALEKVDMKDHILSLSNKLDEEVAEGGDNFSGGQSQLICIARALLLKPKILVMDEATASIDNETDSLIQNMVNFYK